ncbi:MULTISPECIES: hypothetical protein [unclassified Phycicoccus]|uniref:hypothetical protein n=1 Tax=unclassified Phycicoccus TaxID=2637926 RepID=UPI0007037F09|nr:MULTISPECIES: hypothetical protein [unclassified Phycicoccus]KQU70869.1 hypothetical protein ASC58_03640 [Phycicoccus sp. Root101]KQZ89158.1 hypothetical protein ASD62_07420 [Phycicoccus sp. Root563]
MNIAAATLRRPHLTARGLTSAAVLAAALSVPVTGTGSSIEAVHAPPQVRVAAVSTLLSLPAMGKLDV